jgi:solute carrier family 25 carnitine/acylcarnitine transporter 20/29
VLLQVLLLDLLGINSWIFTFPFDTIKTVIQATPPEVKTPTQYKVFKKLLTQTGYKSLYSGLTPTILLACSLNGAVFIGFELTHRYLERFLNK